MTLARPSAARPPAARAPAAAAPTASRAPSGRLALTGLALLLAVGASLATGPVRAETAGCRDGFVETAALPGTSIEDVLVTTDGAWAVGTSRVADTSRPLVLRYLYGSWAPMAVPTIARNDGLSAVAGTAPDDVWAVGYTTDDNIIRPLAMRWDGAAWAVSDLGREGAAGGSLTDIAVSIDGVAWAVGFQTRPEGTRPLAMRFREGRWSRVTTPRSSRPSTLTAVTLSPDATLWAVGSDGIGARARPVVLRLRNGRWDRMTLPRFSSESVLTDVSAASARDIWAVGYEHLDGMAVPVALRLEEGSWRRVPPPDGTLGDTMLAAVSTPSSGGTWVTGSRWDPEAAAFRSYAAWWDGQAWSSVPSSSGGTELHGVDGAPDVDGWVVGRSRRGGIMSRVCLAPETGLYGGSEPVDPGGAGRAGEEGRAPGERASRPKEARDGGRSARGGPDGGRSRSRARPPRLRPARPLEPATVDPGVLARDVAAEAGLAESTLTYGGVVADFDADGDPDLYIGRHSRPGRLVLNEGGAFRDHAPFLQPREDRHGCAAADVDASGLPDLLCVVGALRGSGLKANELWLDPGGPSPVNASGRSGLIDPTGRGRQAVFLAFDDDDRPDAILANSPTRVDGLPSPSRLFLGSDAASFTQVNDPGFDLLLGARTLEAADIDGDGRDDLLVVPHVEQVPEREGVRLYRRNGTGFADSTAAWGVAGIDDRDAHLVDLDGDGRPDLVQVSPTRIRVSLWRRGAFRLTWERAVRGGTAVASGDVNGDAKADLYLLRGAGTGNPADVVLVNRDRGRAFRSIVVPQTSEGDADEVLSLDHDANGLADFVVLNGGSLRGPIQLIAFYPRGSAARRGR
jgi:hypothetical protein